MRVRPQLAERLPLQGGRGRGGGGMSRHKLEGEHHFLALWSFFWALQGGKTEPAVGA